MGKWLTADLFRGWQEEGGLSYTRSFPVLFVPQLHQAKLERVALLRNIASGLPLLMHDFGWHRPWLAVCCCLCSRGESVFAHQLLQFVIVVSKAAEEEESISIFTALVQGKKPLSKEGEKYWDSVTYWR